MFVLIILENIESCWQFSIWNSDALLKTNWLTLHETLNDFYEILKNLILINLMKITKNIYFGIFCHNRQEYKLLI